MAVPESSPPLRVVGAPDRPKDWESVYQEHVAPLYRFVYSRTGNTPDAEDVTSTTFIRALPRLRYDVSPAEIQAYLRTTARSVLADVWRERHGTVLMEFDEQRDAAHPPERHDEVDITPILDGLPANYRSVLELRFLRGYSIRETAAAMGVSIANAKVLQLRALRRAATTGARDVES
ncbi:MAG TPA: sigma-70 family RNA polymerase sigma factor [Candidatus Saccharimonadales bacterium]|nr:sigma-70 family RNA polymerase sigma factor [Candidatus Saccharimonadales bacterium]